MKKILFIAAVIAMVGCAQKEAPESAIWGDQARGSQDFNIGVAGYTYRQFNLDQTLEQLKRADVHFLSIKDFWLPMDATKEQMDTLKAKCQAAGVDPYILGPIYMSSKEQADLAFDYVARFGHKMFIGVPSYDMVEYVAAKVKETGIKVAIHTHGPDSDLFPNIAKVAEVVKDSTIGIGCCMDLGHCVRLGNDIIADIHTYRNWIYDIHMKDETEASRNGQTYDMGRGVMNYRPIIKALREIGYTGKVSLEYESNSYDPTPSVTESIGYFKGVADATK